MDPVVVTYTAYAAVSLGLTWWVARTLFRNGSLFLVDVFGGDEQMARAVNHLLVVGFWLINLGYVSLALRIGGPVPDARTAIESLATKLGGVLLVLGAMHFANLFVLSRVRRGRRTVQHPFQPQPPVAPSGRTVWAGGAPAGGQPAPFRPGPVAPRPEPPR